MRGSALPEVPVAVFGVSGPGTLRHHDNMIAVAARHQIAIWPEPHLDITQETFPSSGILQVNNIIEYVSSTVACRLAPEVFYRKGVRRKTSHNMYHRSGNAER